MATAPRESATVKRRGIGLSKLPPAAIVSLISPPAAAPAARSQVEQIPVGSIVDDAGLQVRVSGVLPDIVSEYAETIADWIESAPVTVYQSGEGTYWLADGWHRLAAARAAGLTQIPAVVASGGRRDALLCALGANAAHGLRRTNSDKRRAVKLMLDDIEWSAWSDPAIAQACGVSRPFVTSIRTALESPQGKNRATKDGNDYRGKESGKSEPVPVAPAEVSLEGVSPRSLDPVSPTGYPYSEFHRARLADVDDSVLALRRSLRAGELPDVLLLHLADLALLVNEWRSVVAAEAVRLDDRQVEMSL